MRVVHAFYLWMRSWSCSNFNSYFPIPLGYVCYSPSFNKLLRNNQMYLPLVALVARTISASGFPPRTSGPSLLGALRRSHELISVWRIMSSASVDAAGVLLVSLAGTAGSVLLSLLCKSNNWISYILRFCDSFWFDWHSCFEPVKAPAKARVVEQVSPTHLPPGICLATSNWRMIHLNSENGFIIS